MTLQEFYDRPETWCQGKFGWGGDARCLEGALYDCYEDPTAWAYAKERLTKTIGRNIVDWNDAPTRTFEDIQRVVREANV